MKKLLLTVMAGIGLSMSANAQLANGSLWPITTTFYDIHGMSHNIISDLDSGYTVFIDISATWCPPCWGYHMTDALDNLEKDYGPGTTANSVRVYFFQGETTSGLCELYGTSLNGSTVTTGESDRAHDTQGNWTVNSGGSVPVSYPIIDDSSSSTNPVYYPSPGMNITYFPTVYKVCRDRIVTVMTQPTEAEAIASVTSCPSYGPATGVDAKAVSCTPGAGSYYCTATGTAAVNFQNYGSTTLTAATINVKDLAGTVKGTVNWTGSLAPYAVGTANVPTSFTGSTGFFYNWEVVATGDTRTSNDMQDSVFKIYGPTNATTVPYFDDLTGWLTAGPSLKYYFPDANGYVFYNNEIPNPDGSGYYENIAGPGGIQANTLIFDCYDASHASTALNNYSATFIFGNYNISGNQALSFDLSYAPKSASVTTDQLEVQVSSDCGATWTNALDISGTALISTSTIPTNWFVPTSASDWKHVTVSLATHTSPDLMIQITGVSAPTAGNGELIYLDNLRIAAQTGVATVNLDNEISMYPNPAHDVVNVDLNLAEATSVSVVIYDAVGRVVSTTNQELTAGNQKIEVSTETLPTGLYNVKIAAGSTVTTKQLTVVR